MKTSFTKHLSKALVCLLLLLGSTLPARGQLTYTIGTGSGGSNTGTTYPAPYGNYWWGARHQYLVKASELTTAGATAGPLSGIGFNVLTANGVPLQDFTIRLKHDTLSNITAYRTGLTTVYSVPSYTEVAGWNIHEFSTAFNWNGVSDLVVEVCFNNSSYTNNALTAWDQYSYTASVWRNADATGVCTNSSVSSTSSYKPQMRFYRPLPRDVQIAGNISPVTGCQLSSSEALTVSVKNSGLNAIGTSDTIPMAYRINNGTIVRDTLFPGSSLASLSATNFTFSSNLNLSNFGNYNIKVWSDYRDDEVRSNDTLSFNVINIPYISSYPYHQGFENGPQGWTAGGATANRWELGVPNQTGINTAANGSNAWMTDLDANYLSSDNAYILSPCYNFTNLRIPYLSFFLNFISYSSYDAMILEVTTDGNNWTKVGANETNFYNNLNNWGNMPAPNWSGNNNGWREYRIALNNLRDESYVRFRFRYNAMSWGGGYPGFAVDSFSVLDSCTIAGALPAPTVDFNIPDTVYINSPALFSNAYSPSVNTSFILHEWFVNGSRITSSEDLTYSFSTTGTHNVKVRTTSCWGMDSITKIVTVVNPTTKPLAGFISDENKVEEFEEIMFTDLSAYGATTWEYVVSPDSIFDPLAGGMVETYFWSTGNQNSRNPGLTFYYPGVYSICQIVTNSLGSDTLCLPDYIEVTAPVLMCGFLSSTSDATGLIYDSGGPNGDYGNNQNCSFLIDPCADTVLLTFTEFELETSWDFLRVYDGTDNTGTPLWNNTTYPNGMTGLMTHASFVNNLMATSGSMYIEFQSDGSGIRPGFAAEWTSSGGSYPAPTASFISADTVCVGTPIAFENTSTGDDLSYLWEINSTTVSTSKNTTQTFTQAGTWNVKLTVENCGGTAVYTKQVVITNPTQRPQADFAANIHTPQVGETVNLTDLSEFCVNPNSYRWTITPSTFNFVGATNANSRNPQVQFSSVGTYTVKLRIANNLGADSITKIDYITVVDYCMPTVGNLSQDIGINRVVIGSINNSSNSGVNGYTSYKHLAPATLEYQSEYVVTVVRNTNLNPINRAVWIDYNQDGDFDDPGELVAFSSSSMTRTWSDSFTVPISAVSGSTIMRVGVNYGSLTNLPCGPNQYGEYEDYRVIISPDVTAPQITLIGSDTVVIAQCDTYMDAGATATDNVDGNITPQIIVTGYPFDTCQVGMHIITYDVEDSRGNEATTISRVVIVEADTNAPVITLAGNNPDTIDVFTSYIEAGYTATDNIQGNITSQVIVTGNVDTAQLGSYVITYSVTDAEGNPATAIRTVVVIDATAPVVTLAGADTVYVEACTGYTEAGASASDNYDATVQLNITGTVDTTMAGIYYLNYCATDASGNQACETRVVIVEDTRAPSVSIIGNDTITVDVFTPFNDPGLNITDDCNTNWTVTEGGTWSGTADSLGCFTKTYTVTDAGGNDSTVSRVICVVDRVAPTIMLNGDPLVYVARWSNWTDPGVTAYDNYDGSPNIIIGGNFSNTLMPGTFFRTYQACDQSNNCSRVESRIILVYNPSDSGVGIAPNALAAAVNVYPNPTSGHFVVEVDLPVQEKVSISVLNMLGQPVLNVMENQTATGKNQLDLTNARSGVYFVRVQSADAVVMKKITLTR